MAHSCILWTLRGNVLSLAQCYRAGVDIIILSLGDLQVNAIGGIWLNVEIAISWGDCRTRQTSPWRGRGGCLMLCAEKKTIALLPFEIDKFTVKF